MSDKDESSPKEGKSKRPLDESDVEVHQDDVAKRARGPHDCLNWDSDSEEEFVPFTQSSSPPKKIFAKKSTAKVVEKKKKGAKNTVKTKSLSASAKGKSLRKLLLTLWKFVLCYCYLLAY